MSSIAASQVDPDRCPWCSSVVSRVRFLEIKTKIAEEERKKLADQAARMRNELQVREAAIRKEAAAEAEARAKADAEKTVAAVRAEKEQGLSKIKQLEAAGQRHQKEIEEVRAATAKGHDLQIETLKQRYQKDLEQQRSSLEKDRDAQLLKVQAQKNREAEQLQEKVNALTRQLQRKRADDLGQGAEVDVFESLKEAFPHDKITRIKSGQPGADIDHQVLQKGEVCGSILIDSKNRQGWQNAYVTKLREDQVTGKADHAILATLVFPSGKRELYVDEETRVVVVNPAHVAQVVTLLRADVVRTHMLGLSLKQRAEKRDLLYRYISSAEYRQHLDEAGRLINEMLDLDVDETRTHQKVWEKRGRMVKRLQNVVRQVDTEVSAVLEGRDLKGSGS